MSDVQVVKRGKRKEFVGIVVSDKMQKTIVVSVDRLVSHGQYTKIIKRKENFKAHDEKNEAHRGDKVRIVETRPMSKDKRWRLAEIIAKAKIVEGSDDL